jgi:radical SAM superfamily enzyme YgiQ (UPF0313 family)
VLLGYPGETKESAWQTIKFVQKVSPDNLAFYNIATPLPGTPMYDQVKKNGWLKITNFDKYDCKTPIFETPTMSMKELEEISEKAFQSFYLRPSYVLRMWRKGWMYGLSATRTAFRYFIKATKSKLGMA